MKIQNKREMARSQATRVISLSLEDARRLPNMLGQIVPLQLELHGWFACKHDGKTTFYERSAGAGGTP
jgi:hypothetical protein